MKITVAGPAGAISFAPEELNTDANLGWRVAEKSGAQPEAVSTFLANLKVDLAKDTYRGKAEVHFKTGPDGAIGPGQGLVAAKATSSYGSLRGSAEDRTPARMPSELLGSVSEALFGDRSNPFGVSGLIAEYASSTRTDIMADAVNTSAFAKSADTGAVSQLIAEYAGPAPFELAMRFATPGNALRALDLFASADWSVRISPFGAEPIRNQVIDAHAFATYLADNYSNSDLAPLVSRLLSQTVCVSHEAFVQQLNTTVLGCLSRIAEDCNERGVPADYFVISDDLRGKSTDWVIGQAKEAFATLPPYDVVAKKGDEFPAKRVAPADAGPRNQTTPLVKAFDDYLAAGGQQVLNVVLIDDASYSGNQLMRTLRSVVQCGEYVGIRLKINVAVPFLTGAAIKVVQEGVDARRTKLKDGEVVKQYPHDIFIAEHQTMTAIAHLPALSDAERDKLLKEDKVMRAGDARMANDLPEPDRFGARTLTVFAHKVADGKSTLTYHLNGIGLVAKPPYKAAEFRKEIGVTKPPRFEGCTPDKAKAAGLDLFTGPRGVFLMTSEDKVILRRDGTEIPVSKGAFVRLREGDALLTPGLTLELVGGTMVAKAQLSD